MKLVEKLLMASSRIWIFFLMITCQRGIIVPFLVLRQMHKLFNTDSLTVAAVVGTLTNTILVVGALVIFDYIPMAVVWTLIPQIIAEIVIAVIITIAVVTGWKRIEKGGGGSSV